MMGPILMLALLITVVEFIVGIIFIVTGIAKNNTPKIKSGVELLMICGVTVLLFLLSL